MAKGNTSQSSTRICNGESLQSSYVQNEVIVPTSQQNNAAPPNCENVVTVLNYKNPEVTVPRQENAMVTPVPIHENVVIVSSHQNHVVTHVPSHENLVTVRSHENPMATHVPSHETHVVNVPNHQTHVGTAAGHENSVTVPSHENPEVTVPSHENPEVTVPSHENPEVTVPSHENPEVIVPSHENPELIVPSHENPEVTVPSHENPEVIVPSHENPEVTVPSHENPEVIVPSHENPEVTVPSHENPEVTVPSHENSEVIALSQQKDAPVPRSSKTNIPVPESLQESEGVRADHSYVNTFHLRVPVNPYAEGSTGVDSNHSLQGARGYSDHSKEEATGYNDYSQEGATGYNDLSHEGATGYSDHLQEGATSKIKDSTKLDDVITRYESSLCHSCQLTVGRCNTCYKDSLVPSHTTLNPKIFQKNRYSGRELSPRRHSHSPGEKHGEKILLHRERYSKPTEECSDLHVHHLRAVKPFQKNIDDLQKRVKEKYQPSVGKILFCSKFQGNCFVVGENERRFIVAANHIFLDIGEHFRWSEMELALKAVVVQFGTEESHYYRLNPDVRVFSDNLDYIAVELKPHTVYGFPPPIREFGRISRLIKDERVICVAFQNGNLWQDMTGALYIVNILRRLDSMKDSLNSKELVDLKKEVYKHKMNIIATSMIYGSSGGIVVHVDTDSTMRVVGMILKGYPREFYERPPGHREIKGCQLVEVMVPIEEIANHFKGVVSKIPNGIFDGFV